MGTAHSPQSTRARRGRSDRTSPKPSAKPLGAAATGRRAATGKSATVAVDAPAAALLKIQYGLELIRSSVVVVARALMEQNCEVDDDAARVLRHHVTDALTDQMVRIGLLIDGGAS
jgi:hypothetical protein